VSVALGIQHAMRMRHIFIGRLSDSTIFSTLSHNGTNLKKKKERIIEHKMGFDFLYNFV
jgi:hypothetical protein